VPDDSTELPARSPRDDERLAVVRALAQARSRGQITQADQLERTDMAIRADTLTDLAALVEDLDSPPALPGPLSSRRGLLLGVAGLAAGVVVGAVGAGALSGSDGSEAVAGGTRTATAGPTSRPTASPTAGPTASPTAGPTAGVTTPVPSAAPVPVVDLFTVAGIETLFADYREQMGTWKAYELTVINATQARADAVVRPIGKRRLQWWSWDPDERWNTIFDPRPVGDPGVRAVDLRDFDLAAVLARVPKAQRSLNVEGAADVDLRFFRAPGAGSVVVISVSNQFREHGALVVDRAGRIIERHPFVRS